MVPARALCYNTTILSFLQAGDYMPYYDNWDSLYAAACLKCKKILRDDVVPVADEIVKRHIETDIYAAYTPRPGAWVDGTTYQRRRELPDSLIHLYSSDGTEVLITSEAKASKSVVKGYSFHHRRPGAFLSLFESDNTGIWNGGFARPAISNAQREINSSKQIQAAIQTGIEREFES